MISWTPLSAQGNTTNLFTTIVIDDGIPPLSATNSFQVFVNPAPIFPPPLFTSVQLSNDVVILTWTTVHNGTYRLQYNEDLAQTNWTDLTPDFPAGTASSITATNPIGSASQRFYRVWVVPLP